MWVDGVQRVVCGVTEATTCQEVVIALAQAIGEESQYDQEMSCYFDIPCRGWYAKATIKLIKLV